MYNDIVTTVGKGNGSFLVLLELSAAFDTIDHDYLLYILEKYVGIGGCVQRLIRSYFSDRTQTVQIDGIMSDFSGFLMVLYKGQNMRVRWNSTFSDFFSVSNGVKRGGVLSPILFSLYLDTLLLGIGCHMNGLYTGAFIYAHDITSMAPSCYALNSILNVCEEYALSHDILFNSLKTKYML